MPDFGALHYVDVRDLWRHEAHEFTPWLATHLTALGESIGLDLELTEQEACVGAFFCDLVAKEINTDRIVIIENQLEAADHSHFGQLLTYAAGKEASVAIWIAREIRDEYRQALTWLNSRTDTKTEFFGIVLEAFRIDDSKPVVNFKIVAAPNEWRKKAAEATAKSVGSKDELYRQFFEPVVDELREVHLFTNARRAQPQNWMIFPSGIRGAVYGLNFPQGNKVRSELYIDFGDQAFNKAFFDAMALQRSKIESAFGSPLSWERLDGRRASRIATYRKGAITDTREDLESIRAWGVSNLLSLKRVLGPLLDSARAVAVTQAEQQAVVESPLVDIGEINPE